MNEGVRILIERMESNPEDFALRNPGDAYLIQGHGATWRGLVEYVVEDKRLFTEEEKSAVETALIEVSRKNFTAKVLELLTAPPVTIAEYQRREYGKSAIVGPNHAAAQVTLTGVTDPNKYQRVTDALMNRPGIFATSAMSNEG